MECHSVEVFVIMVQVILPCPVPASEPPALIQWSRAGVGLNMTGRYQLVSLAHLLIERIEQGDAGEYR